MCCNQIYRRITGFTVIEILIVVAIIGVLSTIAVPAYKNYINRSAASEALVLVEPAKLAVADYYHVHNEFPGNNTLAGLESMTQYVGKYVTSIEVSANGKIEVSLNLPSAGTGKILDLTPQATSSAILWTCTTPASGSGTLSADILPRACTAAVATRSTFYNDPNEVTRLGLWNQNVCQNSGGTWHPGWAWKCDCATTSFLTTGWRANEGCVAN